MEHTPEYIARMASELEEMRKRCAQLESAQTELAPVREALRESEEKYRTVFEYTGTAMIVLENDTTVSMWNHKLEEVTGYSQEDAKQGRSWTEFVVPEDLPRLQEYHAKRRENPASVPSQYEFRLRHKSGGVRDMYMTVSMIPGTSKSLVSLIDMTDRRKAESALRQSERRYRDLFENANDIIYVHDFDGRFLSVNAAGLRTYGYSEDEIRSLTIRDIVDPEWVRVALDNIHKKLTLKEKSEPYVLLTHRRDRTPVWVEVSTRIITENGQPAGVQGVARDITDRRRAQDELDENRRRFQDIAELLPGIICEMDADFRVTYVNKRGLETFGYTPEDFEQGIDGYRVVPEALHERVKTDMANVLKGDFGNAQEYVLRRKDGTEFWALINSAPVYRDGTFAGLRTSITDISGLKQAQEKLRESERRFKDIADLLPGIICELDPGLRFTYVNNLGIESFGYGPQDIAAGVSLEQLMEPGEFERVRRNTERLARGEAVGSQEYRMRRRDGAAVHCLVNTAPILKDGAVTGFRSCLIDISERKQTEQKLRDSEERFRSIVTFSPIGIGLFGADGRLESANGAFKGMFCPQERSSVETPDLFALAGLDERQRRTLTAGGSLRHEAALECTPRPGSATGPAQRFLDWSLTILGGGNNGAPLILAQVQDITDRKKVEESRLKEACDAADKANRMVESLKKEMVQTFSFSNMVSRSAEMRRIFDILPEMARTSTTVLVNGESGTGKELVARALHELSPRKARPFIAINCSALPDNLLESELFGYKAGAFTDAKKDKPGKFALAEGGTLFLDEIGDISAAMQVKLLRVLQERVYEPLGATQSVKADVRVVAATNKDLLSMVKGGAFREDLYYRINVLQVKLPPLRQRRSDIPILCEHFIGQFNRRFGKSIAGMGDDALEILLAYDYPGNIRQLENIIEHAFVFCKEPAIGARHLPADLPVAGAAAAAPGALSGIGNFDQLEKAYLESVLAETGGNKLEAARRLGIHKTTLFRKIRRLGMS